MRFSILLLFWDNNGKYHNTSNQNLHKGEGLDHKEEVGLVEGGHNWQLSTFPFLSFYLTFLSESYQLSSNSDLATVLATYISWFVLIPVSGKSVFFFKVWRVLQPLPAHLALKWVGGIIWQGCEADHSRPTSSQVKNAHTPEWRDAKFSTWPPTFRFSLYFIPVRFYLKPRSDMSHNRHLSGDLKYLEVTRQHSILRVGTLLVKAKLDSINLFFGVITVSECQGHCLRGLRFSRLLLWWLKPLKCNVMSSGRNLPDCTVSHLTTHTV